MFGARTRMTLVLRTSATVAPTKKARTRKSAAQAPCEGAMGVVA